MRDGLALQMFYFPLKYHSIPTYFMFHSLTRYGPSFCQAVFEQRAEYYSGFTAFLQECLRVVNKIMSLLKKAVHY